MMHMQDMSNLERTNVILSCFMRNAHDMTHQFESFSRLRSSFACLSLSIADKQELHIGNTCSSAWNETCQMGSWRTQRPKFVSEHLESDVGVSRQ